MFLKTENFFWMENEVSPLTKNYTQQQQQQQTKVEVLSSYFFTSCLIQNIRKATV